MMMAPNSSMINETSLNLPSNASLAAADSTSSLLADYSLINLTTMNPKTMLLNDSANYDETGEYDAVEREDASAHPLFESIAAGIFPPLKSTASEITDYYSSSSPTVTSLSSTTPNPFLGLGPTFWSGSSSAASPPLFGSTSISIYIFCFIGVLPAAIGGAVWWIKGRRGDKRAQSQDVNSEHAFENELSEPPPLWMSAGAGSARRPSALSIGGMSSIYGYNMRPDGMVGQMVYNIHQPVSMSPLAKLNSGVPFDPSAIVVNGLYENSSSSSKMSPDENASLPSHHSSQRSNITMGSDKQYPIEVSRNVIEMDRLIGEGNFGQVWRARMFAIGGGPPTEVAVKTTKIDAKEEEAKNLLSELDIMLELKYHPNVIQVLACCTKSAPFYIVMEFASPGRLLDVLRSHRREVSGYSNYERKGSVISIESNRSLLTQTILRKEDLIQFAIDIAKGMAFIHDHSIVHRDLAARNILVSRRVCKIADFGLARQLKRSSGEEDWVEEAYEQKSRGALPLRWMGPEALCESRYTLKSDVWSFGVLLWEITTLGAMPYPGLSSSAVMSAVKKGHVMDRPPHTGLALYELMRSCWSTASTDRPPFPLIGERLTQMLESHVGYIDLNHVEKGPVSYYNIIEPEDEDA